MSDYKMEEDRKLLNIFAHQNEDNPQFQKQITNDLNYIPIKLIAVKQEQKENQNQVPLLKYIAKGGITSVDQAYTVKDGKVELLANHMEDCGGVFKQLQSDNSLVQITVLEQDKNPVLSLIDSIDSVVQELSSLQWQSSDHYAIVVMFQGRFQIKDEMLQFLANCSHQKELGGQTLVNLELLNQW